MLVVLVTMVQLEEVDILPFLTLHLLLVRPFHIKLVLEVRILGLTEQTMALHR